MSLQSYFNMFQQLHPAVQVVVVGAAALSAMYLAYQAVVLINAMLEFTNNLFSTVFGFLKTFFRGPDPKETVQVDSLPDLSYEDYETMYDLGRADRVTECAPRIDLYGGDLKAYLDGWHSLDFVQAEDQEETDVVEHELEVPGN